ncbi:MAG: FkbM family methyltransferase [Acidobacteriota bacterium]
MSESPTPLLVIPAETFSRYGCSTGIIPAGFVVDWLGTHTRGDVEDYLLSSDVAPFISYDRYFEPTPPLAHELVLDWLPLLDAVELAGHTFTIVALGAGWGRWIVAGAFAALKRGRDYRVVGVEAEPTHFAWMERHLRDNNIDPDRARLIQAAANSYTGTCQFMVGNPTGIYGQRIIDQSQEASDELRVAFNAELQRLGVTPQEVLCVDLEEVFQGLERVDYMHMDIQGAEADVLLAKPDLLDERVAVINVGAHSELIERRLRRHFLSRGWHRMYDVPMGASVDVRLEGSSDTNRITWGDGVQVWENRRLTRRQSGPSFVVGAA